MNTPVSLFNFHVRRNLLQLLVIKFCTCQACSGGKNAFRDEEQILGEVDAKRRSRQCSSGRLPERVVAAGGPEPLELRAVGPAGRALQRVREGREGHADRVHLSLGNVLDCRQKSVRSARKKKVHLLCVSK